MSFFPTFSDTSTIHDNVASEISGVGAVAPAAGDFLLAEDIDAANIKIRVTAAQVGALGASAHALGSATHTADTLANLNTKISDATLYEPDSVHAVLVAQVFS